MKQCIYCDIHFKLCHNSNSKIFLHNCKDQSNNCSLYISRDDYEDKRIKSRKSKSLREELDWTTEWHEVHVYWHQSNCYRQKHKRIDYNAKVYDSREDEFVHLKVFYCENCKKFFTNGKLLPSYDTMHNYHVMFHGMPDSYYSDLGMSPESILKQHGYNVRANGPSSQKRHNILQEVILEEIMKPYEIIDHISRLIDLHYYDPKWKNALQKYREDLEFLNDFKSQYYSGKLIIK